MRNRIVLALTGLLFAVAVIVACGSNGGDTGDGGLDGSTDGSGCWSNCGGGDGGDGGACTNLGATCASNGVCCSGNCLNGACQPPACTSDNQACTSDGQCCGGKCTNGTCAALNPICKSLGNKCTAGTECCSTFCVNGICGQPSYCGQAGDTCQHATDCCGGICTIAQGSAFGVCGQPPQSGAQCSAVDGVVCMATDAGLTDSGLPMCGGDCCSRSCAPWGPTQVFICQPASGCHPVGDICAKDSDCCGGQGTNPIEVCNKTNPSDPVGVCSNPTGCKPNGDICRLQTNQCNATDNCCSGNVQQYDTCKQDNLGVPRCSYAGDAGCIMPGADAGCASSADCCNLNPCVPNGTGGYTCYPQTCVPLTGNCTNDGDCCPGGHCYIPGGQASGTCQPPLDGGSTCDGGLLGQTCTTNADCCNGVPCTNGRCEIVVY